MRTCTINKLYSTDTVITTVQGCGADDFFDNSSTEFTNYPGALRQTPAETGRAGESENSEGEEESGGD